jgi:hypothetical protein
VIVRRSMNWGGCKNYLRASDGTVAQISPFKSLHVTAKKMQKNEKGEVNNMLVSVTKPGMLL